MAKKVYTQPDPSDLESGGNESGLPWGGYNLGYISAMDSSKSRERISGQSSTAESPSNTGQGRGSGSR